MQTGRICTFYMAERFRPGDSEFQGIWKKPGKWEPTKVRWLGEKVHGPVGNFTKVKRITITSRWRGTNGCILLGKIHIHGWSRFATNLRPSVGDAAAVSSPPRVTGSITNAVRFVDADSLVKQLPLKVSAGIILESLGTLYGGPNEDKYWSELRCGVQHPYPVGYTATKTYKGVKFKQIIEEGPDGPLFVVGEVGKASYRADSPAKAWSLALSNSTLNTTARIHGRKHFGFDCPMVLGLLSHMKEEQVVKTGVEETSAFKMLSRKAEALEKVDLKLDLGFDARQTGSESHNDRNQLVLDHSLESKMDTQAADQVNPSISNVTPNSGALQNLIRLRSDLMEDIHHQKFHVLSYLGQDSNNGGTKDYFQKVVAKSKSRSDDLQESLIRRAFAIEGPLFSGSTINKSNTLDPNKEVLKQDEPSTETFMHSIMSSIDGETPIYDQGGNLDNSEWNPDHVEKRADGRTTEDWKPKTSSSPLLSLPFHRSRISLDEVSKHGKRGAGTRSLAYLFDGWNNSKRADVGSEDGHLQQRLQPRKVEKLPSTEEDERQGSLGDKNVLCEITDEDLEGRVNEWGSGKEGQSSVLDKIQQLIGNGRVDEALRVLQRLHSSGFHLDDTVYSKLFPFQFDDWQKRAAKEVKKSSVLVCAPSGAGKSSVAALCLYQAFVRGERCLFVTPHETVAKEHVRQFQVLFGSKSVGSPSKAVDEWSQFAITVMTLETLSKVLREGRFSDGSTGTNPFARLSLAVMDRFHTLGDSIFGSLWEEAIMLLECKVKLMMLSLPMKASHKIISWISSIDRPCVVVTCDSEPLLKSYYSCDIFGLHLLVNSGQRELQSSSYKPEDPLMVDGDSRTGLQRSIRVLLSSFHTEELFPLAITLSSMDECIASMEDTHEVILGEHMSREEVACIEERLQIFFEENADVLHLVTKADIQCLLHGYTMFHDRQLPSWLAFVQKLICDNLVKIVYTTTSMMCKTEIFVHTMALCLNAESKRSSHSSSEFMQLVGKAGRRGLDSNGNVVFLGSNQTGRRTAVLIEPDSTISIYSHFKPSYSLLLNLLSKHTVPEVRKLIESNYGDYLVKKFFHEELKELEGKVSEVEKRKRDLEVKLSQESKKTNVLRLQEATVFTQVDVIVTSNGHPQTESSLQGLLFAVLPGPSGCLYMILCADNNFRLLPACALDHVYIEEPPLDAVYESLTGDNLPPPQLPSKENWKISPGDYLAYIADGTSESARIVVVLLQHGAKFSGDRQELSYKEEIGSCNELLASLFQQHQLMVLSRENPVTTAWAQSEKLVGALEKANALGLISTDKYVKIKPLGVLISRLHHVDNELWYTIVLSSGIVRPLTAPELGAICSALVFTGQSMDSGGPGSDSGRLSKRLRVAMEKLENLRQKVLMLQGSDIPPVRLNGGAITAVHSLGRERVQQDLHLVGDPHSRKDWMVPVVEQTVKLLQLVDDVWGRSPNVLSALGGTSGLHNVARRATHLLQRSLHLEDNH